MHKMMFESYIGSSYKTNVKNMIVYFLYDNYLKVNESNKVVGI